MGSLVAIFCINIHVLVTYISFSDVMQVDNTQLTCADFNRGARGLLNIEFIFHFSHPILLNNTL